MKNIFLFFLLTLGLSLAANAQQVQLTASAEVSVLTCGPGTDLYSAYGHSAFRIQDPNLNLDLVYNYGTFDFNAPNFYLNFAKGKLTYMLSTTRFVYFMHSYRKENRWVKGQVLNLTSSEVQAVFNFLEENAKPSNRSYQYDFFYDNCATKIEDVIRAVLKEKVTFPNEHITSSKTHRDLIADYTSDFKWGKFGIDLALGAVIDKEATKDDYKFLPDYIFYAFEQAQLNTDTGNQPLVRNVVNLHQEEISATKSFNPLESPLVLFTLLAVIIIYITFINYKNNKRYKWLDFSLFVITGLIGIAVLLLWFATTHTATYQNYNFLWAFAPNIIVGFYLLKKSPPNWILPYLKLLLVLLGIMVILWILQVQNFNIAMIPIVVALVVRYTYLLFRSNA